MSFTRFLFIVIVITVVSSSIGLANPSAAINQFPNTQNNVVSREVDQPLIGVIKISNRIDYELQQKFVILIEITNYGDQPAYDVQFEESKFPDWTFETEGLTSYSWSKMEAGENHTIAYTLVPLKEGNFTIEQTLITYSDQPSYEPERQIYSTKSNLIELHIVDFKEQQKDPLYWNVIGVLSFTFAGSLIILVIVRFLCSNRPEEEIQ